MENNQRYKELKYEGKTYTQKYQINEILLKNKMNWFLDCEVENARIEIVKDTLIFNGGVFYNGVWEYGVIRDGDIRNISFQNGVIYNGTFKKIKMEKGIVFGGTFLRGDVLFADIRGGDFKDVNISNNVNQTEKEEKPAQPVQVPVQTQSGQTQAQPVQVQGEVQNQDAKQIQSQVQERYIKKFGSFINESVRIDINESVKSISVRADEIADEINDIRNEVEDWQNDSEVNTLLDELENINYEYDSEKWQAVKI